MFTFIVMSCCLSSLVAHEASPPQSINFNGHTAEVTSLVFSLDGNQIYSTSLKEDRIWSSLTAETLGHLSNARGHSIALSPDGKRIVVAGFKTTSMYDAETRRLLWSSEIKRKRYSPPYLFCLAFSPDGKTLATSGSSVKVGGTHGLKAGVITILDVESGKQQRVYEGLSTAAQTIAFSPNGRLLAGGTEGAEGELPDTGELLVWDLKTGNLKHRLKHKKQIKAGQNRCSVSGVAFHPAGGEIAIASSDGTVRVWDLKLETIRITLTGHEKPVRRVAYRPDGKRLASAGMDRTVKIWDTQNGNLTKSLSTACPKVNTVVFSSDGLRLAVGGGDFLRSGIVKIWTLSKE